MPWSVDGVEFHRAARLPSAVGRHMESREHGALVCEPTLASTLSSITASSKAGQPAFPDPTLLYVRGFNAATNSYIYSVNQRFGETRAALSIPTAPFQATLEMRINIGPQPESQQGKMTIRQMKPAWKARHGRAHDQGPPVGKLSDDSHAFLQQKDSLALTPTQIDSATKLFTKFNVVSDSLFAPIAKLPDARCAGADGEIDTASCCAKKRFSGRSRTYSISSGHADSGAAKQTQGSAELSARRIVHQVFAREQATKPIYFGF